MNCRPCRLRCIEILGHTDDTDAGRLELMSNAIGLTAGRLTAVTDEHHRVDASRFRFRQRLRVNKHDVE